MARRLELLISISNFVAKSMFYKIDSTRISLREYWWGSRSPMILAGVLVKFLRIQVPSSSDDPNVESLQPFEVPEDALPEEVRERFRPLIAELAGLGFHSAMFHALNDTFHSTKIYQATFCHDSGQASARIFHRIWSYPHPPKVYLFPMFISAFNDGTFLLSSAGKADMAAPPTCRVNRMVGATPTALWTSHLQQLGKETSRAVYSVTNRETLAWLVEHHHAAIRDFHLRRGVFKPMAQAELGRVAALEESLKASQASGLQHPEIMAELTQLQNKKASWRNIGILFAVSLLAFLVTGAKQWSWELVLLMIPVLLLHELGHYLAMRIFHYRNLRMFFIPFLGAAVSGQHYNVPGWKKAIVYLMGPVPGIFLGVVLGCVGLFLHHALLTKVAMFTLLLNGFNLLPVLPLDGGWVMHSLLFSRHYLLDTGFRILAALALIAISFLSKDKVLMYVGIATLAGLPPAYRMARIATDLRRRGISAAAPDDQTIPTETAEAIIGEVKKAFPKRVTNKNIAQFTLNIFENLNARPPNWWATGGLLFVHGTSFVLAAAFGLFFVFGQSTNLKEFVATAASLPQNKLTCNSLRVWNGAVGAQFAEVPPSTIIANFKGRGEAETAFQGLTNRLPTNTTALLFGQSVMIAVSTNDASARKEWFDQLQRQTTNLFVDSPKFSTAVAVSCIAPTEAAAKEIEQELNGYFQIPAAFGLVPPWAVPDIRSTDLRRQHQLARETYARLKKADYVSYKDPQMIRFRQKMNQARKEGDSAELQKLQVDQKKFIEDSSKRYLENLRTEGPDKVDVTLVDLT